MLALLLAPGFPRGFGLIALAGLAGCTDPGPGKPRDSVPPDTETAGPDSAPDTDETDETAETAETGDTDTAEPPGAPIFVLVLADDLGENYLWAMPTVVDRLAPECVRFTRAYATVPLCCPVRASFLTGGEYPAETGVQTNDYPNGGIALFHDGDTLATRLQRAGFRTAIVGKYLNGYEDEAPYIPPGWDLFLVPNAIGDSYDSSLVRGSSTPDAAGLGTYENTGGEHLTGWLFGQALAFLDAHPDEPTFVLITPQSPHIYGEPAAEDVGNWADFAPRPASFDEEDVSDKPLWIQRIELDHADLARIDDETRLMLDNLMSLDRAVGDLMDGLEARELLDRTVLVFASDNGHLHGEHRINSKGVAYEEAVRVPVLIRAPGATPREDERLVAMNLDLPATIAEFAGLPLTGGGHDLGPAIFDPTAPDTRDHVFLETAVGDHPVWASVVTDRWKYVEWGNGETELYDLAADAAELDSLDASPPDGADVEGFAAWVDEHRSLAVTTRAGDPGTVGVAYTAQFEAWAGTAPLVWSVAGGALPPGLVLDASGAVTGTPTESGSFFMLVRVTDSVASPVTGVPATFAQTLGFTIAAGAEMVAPTLTHPAVASRVSPVRVDFAVAARPGARVRLEASLDDTRDTPAVRSVESVSDTNGGLRVSLPLDAARTWYWRVVIDGVPLDGGVAPARSAIP
ncbi:MAG: sulfatase-like hydrolase/transferase [Pseudomonadota bacterium]|nr:sulfatase-like hydrolase/transferase [Pseudomonadota bacterium]